MLPSPTPAADEALRIALHEGSRHDLWPLFELAHPSPLAIRRDLNQGVVHVATTGGMRVGHSQVLQREGGVYELRSLAVVPGLRRRGLGTRLVARSASWVRDRSGNRLVAAIPSGDLDVLGFYQRLGFRVIPVDGGAEGPEHLNPRGLVADGSRVWLELEV